MENALAKVDNNVVAGFGSSLAFDFMQRQATMLASSALVPKDFSLVGVKDQGERAQKIANTVIALEMANRIGASPFSVMQNIYIVHGKPSWSSTFVIASINGCGRFNALKFEMTGEGESRTCVAYTTEKATGDRLDSPPISISIAKKEGWIDKTGSKWKTMPELMLRYRAATLFGRLYAPEILMGMRAVEELEDIGETTKTSRASNIMDKFIESTPKPAEIPMTKEELAEVTPAEDNTKLLQSIYAALEQLGKETGEFPDDIINELTKGKIGTQIDLKDKPLAFLFDIKLMLDNERTKAE